MEKKKTKCPYCSGKGYVIDEHGWKQGCLMCGGTGEECQNIRTLEPEHELTERVEYY